jgi:uncharacterized protein (TIGR02246 family)
MRRVWIIATIGAIIGLATPASAQDLRQQLERVVATYADAENKGDAAAVAALYTKDGEAVCPFGNAVIKKGQQEIEQYYRAAFNAFKDRHFEIKLDQAAQIRPDVALGTGSFVVTGKAENGDAVKIEGNWSGVLGEGAWKVRHFHRYVRVDNRLLIPATRIKGAPPVGG